MSEANKQGETASVTSVRVEGDVMPGFSITKEEAIRHHLSIAEQCEKAGNAVGVVTALHNAELIASHFPPPDGCEVVTINRKA